MILNQYQLVIFDCDGVLVDSESISCGVIAEMSTALGFPMTTEESIRQFAGTGMSIVQDFIHTNIGMALPADFERQYRAITKARFQSELEPLKGIRRVLEALEVPRCVGSNGPRDKIISNLSITGLDVFFEPAHIFSAYDIQKWKPAPDLYLHAARHLGIAPKDCIVLEDSTAGVQAAKTAGMDVVAYAGEHHAEALRKAGAMWVVGEMEELFFTHK